MDIFDKIGQAFTMAGVLIDYLKMTGAWTEWLVWQLLNIPRDNLWIRVPLWVLWYLALTQPKKVDEIINKATEAAQKIGDPLSEHVWKRTWVWILLAIFAHQILIVALVFKRPKFLRLCFTFGLANYAVSDRLVGATATVAELMKTDPTNFLMELPVGYVGSYAVVLIFLTTWWIWWRDPAYRKEVDRIIAKKGYLVGIPYLLIMDFLPKKTRWKCVDCSHSNPIDPKMGPYKVCEKCGVRNPNAPWNCKKCKTANFSKAEFCEECGGKPPHLGAESGGTPPGDSPDDMEDCPSCKDKTPSLGEKFCWKCGYRRDQ